MELIISAIIRIKMDQFESFERSIRLCDLRFGDSRYDDEMEMDI